MKNKRVEIKTLKLILPSITEEPTFSTDIGTNPTEPGGKTIRSMQH
jgi:hypothetical protein